MGFGISIFLIAVGAVLVVAVGGTASGVAFDTIGIVLAIVGGMGLLVSLVAATTRRTDIHQIVEHQDTHAHDSHKHR